MTGIVESLKRHAARERAISNDGDRAALFVLRFPLLGDRHAERCGDRRRGVAGAEGVVLAFIARKKAGDASFLANRGEAVETPGEELMDIGLMADIPDEHVPGRVKNVVKRNRKLDCAEIRSEVAAIDRKNADHLLADVSRKLLQLRIGKA